MPLYLQSSSHPDYFQSIGRNTISIEDLSFQDSSVSYNLAKEYFRANFLNGKRLDGFYVTQSSFLYIPFDYGHGINSIKAEFIGFLGLKPFIDSSRYPKFLYNESYPNYVTSATELTAVFINKFYCNFRDVFYDQYGIDGSVTLRDDVVYVNFSFARLVSISVSGQDQPISFIIKSKKSYDYLEDFSGKIFYSAGSYYTDAGLTNLANLKIRKEFFPFLLLNGDSSAIRGKVTSTVEPSDDLNLMDLGENLVDDDYVDITPVNPVVIILNTITCSVNSPGYADVVYNGLPYSYEDAQICGVSPVSNGNPIAVIKRDNQSNLNLYKNFTALTSETVSIYANNFRYIKYVTLVNNSIVYTSFEDNSSIASSTVLFSNQVLNLNNYYSIEEDGDGKVLGITFRFVVYKVSEIEAGALTYNLTIPVDVPLPEITSASYNADGSKLELTSNYASTIIYYINGDSLNPKTVSVTDSADGLNQKTLIDISATSKNIAANAYGFFYDFNGGTREPYKSADFNQSIDFEYIITSLELKIKSGSPLVDKTFYDSAGTGVTDLDISPCNQGSFDSYTMYIDYLAIDDIYFYFTFTLAAGFESLYLEIGGESNRLTSGQPISISKEKLFKKLDASGNIKLILLLNNKIPFEIPFQFLNFSTDAPEVISVSSPVVAGASDISVSFELDYRYADLISYSILDQDDSVVYGPVTLPRKSYVELYALFDSGSTASEKVKTNKFEIQSSVTSLKVKVTAANLNSSFGLEEAYLLSSATSLPKRLNKDTPAEVKFYSDEAMTVPVAYISRNVTYYAFLQLKDPDGGDIATANYGDYISMTTPPEFKAVESQDENLDLNGVSVTKINNYLYSFNISAASGFNDDSFVLDITYSPIIGL